MKPLKRYAFGLATTAMIIMLTLAAFRPTNVNASHRGHPSVQFNITVFAGGLNNHRGLKCGPDGNLYVAEGGTGGATSTIGTCDQVPDPVGPYTGSTTGARISRIDQNGIRTTFADELPSSQTSPALGSLIPGVGDIAFVGDSLYAVLAGAGCSHGVPGKISDLVRRRSDSERYGGSRYLSNRHIQQ